MLATQMREYSYSRLIDEVDEYGQPQTIEAEGVVKMAINFASEQVTANNLYSGASYVGFTLNKEVDETYIIQYKENKLKVTYANNLGRYNQVYLAKL
jgi:hypothetical protein